MKELYSIATFFLVIQPCLKISAEYYNSSIEARGTADVPNDDDDRVYFTRQYLHPRIAIYLQCEKCLVTEIVTDRLYYI